MNDRAHAETRAIVLLTEFFRQLYGTHAGSSGLLLDIAYGLQSAHGESPLHRRLSPHFAALALFMGDLNRLFTAAARARDQDFFSHGFRNVDFVFA